MKKNIILLFIILFFSESYSQEMVCFGSTKNYSVDTNEGGGPTPNGTVGSIYTWQIIETNMATITGNGTNTISINWGSTPVGSYTIEVVETNSYCAAPAVTLSVNIKAKPQVSAPNTEVCLGSNTSILATSNPSNPTDVFSWTTPVAYTGLVNGNSIDIITATVAIAGDYTVTVTDVDGCISDAFIAKLKVNPLPDASITSATALEFCAGGNVVLATASGLSHVWNKGGIAIVPSETGANYTASQAGNYTVTITDSKGCSNTTNPAITVTVNPNPTVSVVPTTTQFCDGLSATLTAAPASGTAPFTYQWMNTSGDITTNGTNSSYIAMITSNYKVKVTDSKSCVVTSAVQNIFNRPNPDASITYLSSTTFCAGDSVNLERGSAPISGFTYQWVKDAVDIATTSTNFNYMATESGSYKVRVSDTNFLTNCTITTPVAIVVSKSDLPTTSIITAH